MGDVAVLDEKIDRHSQDIADLKEKVEGLPERMKNIEKQQERLNDMLEKFIDELRKGYQSKETCRLCHELVEAKVKTVEEDNKKLMYMVYSVGGAGLAVLCTYVMKQVGLM